MKIDLPKGEKEKKEKKKILLLFFFFFLPFPPFDHHSFSSL